MAKNFKNFVMGVLKSAGIGIVAFIYCVIDTIWELFCLVSSPIWFPVLLIANPLRAAQELNAKSIREWSVYPVWADWYLTNVHNWLIYYLMRWLWTPFIVLLPMKYRHDFIRESEKNLYDYSVKTQVSYYKTFCDGGKQNLLRHGHLSNEALARIWEDETEHENWVDSGRSLSNEQIAQLCRIKRKTLLWRYLKAHTPSKETLDLLLEHVRMGYSPASYALLQLIRQQRPTPELVSRLLNTENQSFISSVNQIIDNYADNDAVNFGKENFDADAAKCWTNFCRHKKEISVAAQKKMGYDQYLVYVQTGHKLDYLALQHMCLHAQKEEFLEDILNNEFEKIDATLQTALKSEYWRYSLYLRVKEAHVR